jgi:ring-1,2-phenylacetyl-CoA epoxidase subunit PaaD
VTAASAVRAATVRAALADLPDPELPVVSIDELGILGLVEAGPDGVRVELHPTFVACPATELIGSAVERRLAQIVPGWVVEVAFVFDPPWTSDRISRSGRAKLAAAGIAPPPAGGLGELLSLDGPVPCPYCGSSRTRLDNAFGPTLCRTIRWCPDCRQPFEAVKLV